MSDRWQAIHPVGRIGGLVFVVVAAFGLIGLSGPVSGARLEGWVSGGPGVRAAAVFVLFYVGLTMASIPGPILAGVSGALFGTVEGGLLALTGAVVGSVLAFTVARHVAGDLVERVGGRRLRGLAAWVGRRGFRSMVCARAAPAAPFTTVSYAAGLAPALRLRDFVLATVIVAAPRTFAYAAVGGNVHHVKSPAVVIAGFVILGMGLLGLALGLREGAREGVSLRRLTSRRSTHEDGGRGVPTRPEGFPTRAPESGAGSSNAGGRSGGRR